MAATPVKIITGRRKEAVARVRLVPGGSGDFTVNGRTLDDYFPTRVHRMVAQAPLRLVGREKDYDVIASIKGGGISGQAGAMRLGIARALIAIDPELRPQLKAEGIQVLLKGEIEGPYPSGPVYLWVAADDETRAKAVIDAVESGAFAVDEGDAFEDDVDEPEAPG